MMCLGAMGMGLYRGWSDSPTAVSDSTAQVLRRRAAFMGILAHGLIMHLPKPMLDCQAVASLHLRQRHIQHTALMRRSSQPSIAAYERLWHVRSQLYMARSMAQQPVGASASAWERMMPTGCSLDPAPARSQEAMTTLQAWLAASGNASATDRLAVDRLAELLQAAESGKKRGKRRQQARWVGGAGKASGNSKTLMDSGCRCAG